MRPQGQLGDQGIHQPAPSSDPVGGPAGVAAGSRLLDAAPEQAGADQAEGGGDAEGARLGQPRHGGAGADRPGEHSARHRAAQPPAREPEDAREQRPDGDAGQARPPHAGRAEKPVAEGHPGLEGQEVAGRVGVARGVVEQPGGGPGGEEDRLVLVDPPGALEAGAAELDGQHHQQEQQQTGRGTQSAAGQRRRGKVRVAHGNPLQRDGELVYARFAGTPPPKTLITPALFSRPLPPPSPGEEGERQETSNWVPLSR